MRTAFFSTAPGFHDVVFSSDTPLLVESTSESHDAPVDAAVLDDLEPLCDAQGMLDGELVIEASVVAAREESKSDIELGLEQLDIAYYPDPSGDVICSAPERHVQGQCSEYGAA